AGAGAAYSCEIYIVLAGELADERGRADVGLLFIAFIAGSAGGGCGRRSRCFFFCGCGSGRNRGSDFGRESGSGGPTAVTDHANNGVDLNGVAFGDFDFLKDSAAGAGISASTLSVEISNRGSSRWTLSPGFFSHLVMVPSKIDSPIWGMTTSVAIVPFR